MRKYENIFIGYSPIHIFSAFSLSEKESLLIMPKKFKNIINFLPKKNIVLRFANIPTFTDSNFKKIYSIFFNLIFIFSYRYKCKKLFIPNAAHHNIRIIENVINYKYLNYLDEGSTVLSLIREKNKAFRSNQFIKFILGLLGISVGNNFLDEKFHTYFVFYPEIFKKIEKTKNIKFIPNLEIESKKKSDLRRTFKIRDSQKSILFLTSPLTENGWVEYINQEIFLIKETISKINQKSNKKISIFIKSHYREKNSKYAQLISNKNINYLPNDLPSQIFTSVIKPKIIIGFHSSAIFDHPTAVKFISLSKLIKTKECISLAKGLEIYKEHFYKLTLLENINDIHSLV